jgi:hypothetical protein
MLTALSVGLQESKGSVQETAMFYTISMPFAVPFWDRKPVMFGGQVVLYSHRMSLASPLRTESRLALTGVGVFLVFGACMAALAGTTLVWRGTVLDKAWVLNEPAYQQLSSAGRFVGILFLFLSATLMAAAVGWSKRRFWGWCLAVGIISTQVLGDFVNLARGDFLRGGVGVVIAGALLFYLLRSTVRSAFD